MWTTPVCLFCLQPCQQSKEEEPESEVNCTVLRRFAIFSKNYLRVPDNAISILMETVSPVSNNLLCENCEHVVSYICGMYEDLISVQLKLDWRLRQLQGVLKTPNGVSSRLKSVLEKKLAAQLQGSSQQARDIRLHLLRHCSSGIQKEVFIPLEKNSYVKHLHKIKAESAQDDPHSQLHDFDDFSEQDCDWDSNSAEEPPKLKVKVEQAIEVGNHLVKEEARPFSANPAVESKLQVGKRKICTDGPSLPKKLKKDKLSRSAKSGSSVTQQTPKKVKIEDSGKNKLKTLSCKIACV